MFYDIIPHQTMSVLCLYMHLTYHALLGHAKVCRSACHVMVCMSCMKVFLSCVKDLFVMHHDCNHDLHMIAMMSQCECDDVTHMMQMQ